MAGARVVDTWAGARRTWLSYDTDACNRSLMETLPLVGCPSYAHAQRHCSGEGRKGACLALCGRLSEDFFLLFLLSLLHLQGRQTDVDLGDTKHDQEDKDIHPK